MFDRSIKLFDEFMTRTFQQALDGELGQRSEFGRHAVILRSRLMSRLKPITGTEWSVYSVIELHKKLDESDRRKGR